LIFIKKGFKTLLQAFPSQQTFLEFIESRKIRKKQSKLFATSKKIHLS